MYDERRPFADAAGAALREVRISRGFTQSDLARRCGMTHQQVHKYERGQSRLSLDALMGFLQVLDVSTQRFLQDLEARLQAGDGGAADEVDHRVLHLVHAFRAIPDDAVQTELVRFVRQLSDSYGQPRDAGEGAEAPPSDQPTLRQSA